MLWPNNFSAQFFDADRAGIQFDVFFDYAVRREANGIEPTFSEEYDDPVALDHCASFHLILAITDGGWLPAFGGRESYFDLAECISAIVDALGDAVETIGNGVGSGIQGALRLFEGYN